MKNRLPEPVVVKLIRILPVVEKGDSISLRIELYGCGEGDTALVTTPISEKTTATSGTTQGATTTTEGEI